MFISKIRIKNFRLLKDTTLLLDDDKKQELSLLIGRNNSGKTSLIMLFDKFYRNESFIETKVLNLISMIFPHH